MPHILSSRSLSLQHCPVYSRIVNHEVNEIAVEDINGLESEFMALQHSVQNRVNLLESELVVLDNWQVKREYTRKPSSSFAQPSDRKKPKLDSVGPGTGVDKPQKKQKHPKLAVPSSSSSSSSLEAKVGKEPGKHQLQQQQQLQQQDTSLLKLKGEGPDRFWCTVEPYCVDITQSDIDMLEEGIKSYDNMEELFQVPPPGQHYSRRWAGDDLHNERGESSRLGEMADPLSDWDKPKDTDEEGFDSLLKDAEVQKKKTTQYGPFTERLIGAFLEDPVSAKTGHSKSQLLSKINLPTDGPGVQLLEERVKEELLALGLIDSPLAKEEEEEEDEVLAELVKLQTELASVMEYNRDQHEVLLKLAEEEMKRQEVREELKEVEDELKEWLKKVSVNKAKRKSLGRKEKESIWKVLETREALLLKLN